MSSLIYTIQFCPVSPAVGGFERPFTNVPNEPKQPYSMFWLNYYFDEYRDKWISETMNYSDPNLIYGNRYYKQIIALGNRVLPLILNDLLKSENDWFYALSQLTGTSPVKLESQGDILEMKNDWIEWAKLNQLI